MSRLNLTVVSVLLGIAFVFAENTENASAFNKFMSPEGGVSPMSGTVAIGKKLASISAGEVSVSFDLSYSGNIFKEVKTRNDKSSSGIVGLGWALGRSKIVSENRGTSYLLDDQFYLVSSSGQRSKIFKKSSADSKWWVEGNPYIIVEQITGESDLTGLGDIFSYVKGWKITDTKGVVHEYGDVEDQNDVVLTNPSKNATEYDLFWPLDKNKNKKFGLVGKAIGGVPYYYPSVWNVSREYDIEGNCLTYKYFQVTENLSGSFKDGRFWSSANYGKSYTKESYLTTVASSKGDTLKFTYENKGEDAFEGELYDGLGSNEDIDSDGSDMYIEKYSRRFLSRVFVVDKNADTIGTVNLCYSVLKPLGKDLLPKAYFVKRLLSSVRFFNRNGVETDFEEYDYYTDVNKEVGDKDGLVYPLGALYKIRGKECGWVEYTYKKESLGYGHVESLPLDSILGRGFLENGTPYLVGRKGKKEISVYQRILGSWKKVQDVAVNEISRVDIGDEGWFLIQDKLSDKKTKALVYQWDGLEWVQKYAKELKNAGYSSMLDDSKDVMNVFAGPDYLIYMNVENDDGFLSLGSSSKMVVNLVWSKWGGAQQIKIDSFDDVSVENSHINISPTKNHILIQYKNTDAVNSKEVYVYSFDNEGGLKKTYGRDNLDNNDVFFMGDGYFVGVGEPTSTVMGGLFDWYSWFRAWVWDGSEWKQELDEYFSNDGAYTAMDLQARGQDYYVVRHHAKRYLTTFSWDGERWTIPEGQEHKQMQRFSWFSDAWKWAGFSGSDFFVAGESRLKHYWWGWDVKKYVYLHLFDKKEGFWKHDRLGSMGEKDSEKGVITGTDWFVENKSTRKAKIWDGNEWANENLNISVDVLKKAYSLGGNAFVVKKDGMSEIHYKIGDSFNGDFASYRVYEKKIFEPVVDKIISYVYSFDNGDGTVAYDEAFNTPLFKTMYVTLPDNSGTMKSELCDGSDSANPKEYTVGLGNTCLDEQIGKTEVNTKKVVISKTRKKYQRYRDSSWPNFVYQDQLIADTSLNKGVKVVSSYSYSDKNGLISSTYKKMGAKSTEKVTKYLVDFSNSINDFKHKILDKNRIETLAGEYSCINSCSNGRVVAAIVNGWDMVDTIFKSVSAWSMAPKTKRMVKNNVENDIESIVKDGSKTSMTDWLRSSYNSHYLGNRVIETMEGEKNVKMVSFLDTATNRLLGTAAKCGHDEGLMLSGESCEVNGKKWEGCVFADGVDDFAVHGTSGSKYGRFSAKVLKLSKSKGLSSDIAKPANKPYVVSAWVQSFDNDSVDVTFTIGSKKESKKIKTNKSWQQIFAKFENFGTSSVLFEITTNAPSNIHLQDVRVLPYDAVSKSLFWDVMWNKVQTTVDHKGVASYIVYDAQGRDSEIYSETAEGTVYMVSKNTYVDAQCNIAKNNQDFLTGIKVNGANHASPSTGRTFVLDAFENYVEPKVPVGSTYRYKLYKSGHEDESTWMVPDCGSLCTITFDFSKTSSWEMKIDVSPIDENSDSGDYLFKFVRKNTGWIEYGQVNGFAYGSNPKFFESLDSASVVFKNDENGKKLYTASFDLSQWNLSGSSVSEDFVHSYDAAAYGEMQMVAYKYDNTNEKSLDYLKIYYKDALSGFRYLDLNDSVFNVDNLHVVFDQNKKPTAVFGKTEIVDNRKLKMDSLLYSKSWDESSLSWKEVGAIPVFEKDTFSLIYSGSDTVVSIQQENVTSYLNGVVCDYTNNDANIVVGPDGKLYVAYIGNPKTFKSKAVFSDESLSYGEIFAPSLVVVKRLYDANETNLGKSVWAGPSQISGEPQFVGDILSWDGSIYHAVENALKVKLSVDGNSLYLAVLYSLDDSEEKDIALTVFRGVFENNVSKNGVSYSKYLKWTPLSDVSVAFAKRGNSLQDERNRILYMAEDDLFDMEVRNGVPYIMFRNGENRKKISVIKYVGNRWLAVGNPAFAYPEQLASSADLGVTSKNNPFVVFKQGRIAGYKMRKDRLVSMHYKEDGDKDLVLTSLTFSESQWNVACAFRQYILDYDLFVEYASSINFTPIVRTPGDVNRIEVYVNENPVLGNNSTLNSDYTVNLVEGNNEIEIRIMGTDESMLTYTLHVYKKPDPNPDIWAVGYSEHIVGNLNDTGEVDMEIPVNLSGCDSLDLNLHFGSGWSLLYNGLKLIENTWVKINCKDLPDIIAVNENEDSVKVNIRIVTPATPVDIVSSSSYSEIPYSYADFADTLDFFVCDSCSSWNDDVNKSSSSRSEGSITSSSNYNKSSSSRSEGSISGSSNYNKSSSSRSEGSITSSSNYNKSSSSRSEGSVSSSTNGNNSSSSKPEWCCVSDNVPDAVKGLAYKSKVLARDNLKIGNDVSVTGSLLAGYRVEIGVSAWVSDSIVSSGDIFLANRAGVKDLAYVGNLQKQQGAVYSSATKLTSVNVPSLPEFTFSTGSKDIVIERENNLNIFAGTYRNFAVREKSTVTFGPGDYYFNNFTIDPYVRLVFAKETRIWIANNFSISNFCRVEHAGDVGDLFAYVASSNYVFIGNNSYVKMVLYAPRAFVQIYDHTTYDGYVWSANFSIEPFSVMK